MKQAMLSAGNIKTLSDVHAALQQQLQFPDWYGGNLDALHDLLSTAPDTTIHLDPRLSDTLGKDYARLLRVLRDCAEENPALTIIETEDTTMTLEQARRQLAALQQKICAYNHATGLIGYDGSTAAPKGTAANRAQTLAILSEEIYKLTTGEETVALLEYLDEHKAELTEKEQRIVYLMLKDIRQKRKIPMDEYIAMQRLMAEADSIWREAKENNDFAAFEPTLEKIFATYIKIAGYVAPEKDPYDHWLGEFEEGLDKARCEAFFATMREHIVPLLAKIQTKEQLPDTILYGDFPEDKQAELAHWLMETMGIDLDHCALATTEHPFTTSFGSHFDERITTHYYPETFSPSLYSVVHEGGHALYDMGSADDLAYTVLDGGVSMGIHESQSRFYENLIGRSKAFCELVFPKLAELFLEQMAGYTAEDLYKAVNRAEPSLIRIEADELTYCLHILVRYELEKRVMAGELAVHDLPGEWNRLYKEYLGVDVPDDAHGVLQDTHWAIGAIGYFPSYALGSAYGAQFLRKMKESVDVDECIARGDFGPINAWNREHIWQYGSTYEPMKLFEMAAGEAFDPTVFAAYLEEKYTELYGL